MAEFEIDGIRFELKRLKYAEASRGLALLAEVLGPALNEFRTGAVIAQLIPAVGRGIGRLPELVRLFTPVTRFRHESGRMLDFSEAFAEDVFGDGRIDRAIEYVANCVHAEYSHFLLGGAAQLGERLAKLFPSQTEPTQSSGA